MSGLVVTAAYVNGGTAAFDRVTSLSVTDSLASPAVAMSCRALADERVGELRDVTVSFDGANLFTGRVDRQLLSLSGKGRVLQLEARSRGALLLDNEAEPRELTHVGLAELYRLCLEPYGFSLVTPGDGRSVAYFPVRKGQSEWDAFRTFSIRAYGRLPYLRGNNVFVGAPHGAGTLAVGEGGYPFSRLEHEYLPYSVISDVIIRDEEGRYSSAVGNPDAAFYDVRRRRYVIPPGEFADNIGLDANQRIRRSMLLKERVAVTLPGIVPAEPGQGVNVFGGDFSIANLMLDELVWRFGEAGIVTEMSLRLWGYYD